MSQYIPILWNNGHDESIVGIIYSVVSLEYSGEMEWNSMTWAYHAIITCRLRFFIAGIVGV